MTSEEIKKEIEKKQEEICLLQKELHDKITEEKKNEFVGKYFKWRFSEDSNTTMYIRCLDIVYGNNNYRLKGDFVKEYTNFGETETTFYKNISFGGMSFGKIEAIEQEEYEEKLSNTQKYKQIQECLMEAGYAATNKNY